MDPNDDLINGEVDDGSFGLLQFDEPADGTTDGDFAFGAQAGDDLGQENDDDDDDEDDDLVLLSALPSGLRGPAAGLARQTLPQQQQQQQQQQQPEPHTPVPYAGATAAAAPSGGYVAAGYTAAGYQAAGWPSAAAPAHPPPVALSQPQEVPFAIPSLQPPAGFLGPDPGPGPGSGPSRNPGPTRNFGSAHSMDDGGAGGAGGAGGGGGGSAGGVGGGGGGGGGSESESDDDEEEMVQYNDTQCFYCDDGGSHLLLCDGVCRRAFHFDCLGYSENERDALLNSTAPWFCPECEVDQHSCFTCRNFVKGDEIALQCQQYGCSHFFHPSCINPAWTSKDMQGFRCATHACQSCGEPEERDQTHRNLVPCRICTVSYHVECIPMKMKKDDHDLRQRGLGLQCRLWLPIKLGGISKKDDAGNNTGEDEIEEPLMYCERHQRREADPALPGVSAYNGLWYPLNDKKTRAVHIFPPLLLHAAAKKTAERLRQSVRCLCNRKSCERENNGVALPLDALPPPKKQRPAPEDSPAAKRPAPSLKPRLLTPTKGPAAKGLQVRGGVHKAKAKPSAREATPPRRKPTAAAAAAAGGAGARALVAEESDDDSDENEPLSKRVKGLTAPRPKSLKLKPTSETAAAAARKAGGAARKGGGGGGGGGGGAGPGRTAAGAGAKPKAPSRQVPPRDDPRLADEARPVSAARVAPGGAAIRAVPHADTAEREGMEKEARDRMHAIFKAVLQTAPSVTREMVEKELVETGRPHHFKKRCRTVDEGRLRQIRQAILDASSIMRDETTHEHVRRVRVMSMVALAGGSGGGGGGGQGGGGGRIVTHELRAMHQNLRTWLKTWLFGHRYTANGRHFTNPDKLQEIVRRLEPFLRPGDCIVDSSCGKNEWLPMMLDACGRRGFQGTGASFEIVPPPNSTGVTVMDWLSTRLENFPCGDADHLIVGLNPPFGVNNADAERFIQHAARFRPRMMAWIVPQSTQLPVGYDVIMNDTDLLSGHAFYLPTSFDISRRARVSDWNKVPPAFYILVRSDWVHRAPYAGAQSLGQGSMAVPRRGSGGGGGGQSMKGGLTGRPGDWDCHTCGFMGNFGSRDRCKQCNQLKPGAGGRAAAGVGGAWGDLDALD